MTDTVTQIFNYFENYFLFILCIFTGQFLLSPKIKHRRSHFLARTISSLLFTIGISVLAWWLSLLTYNGFNVYGTLNYHWLFVTNVCVFIMMFVSCVFGFYFVFDIPLREVFVISIISYLTQHLCHQLNDLCFSMATNQYISDGLYSLMGLGETSDLAGWIALSETIFTAEYIGVCAIVYTVFYFAFVKRFKANYRKLIKNSTLFFLAVGTLVIAIVFNSVNFFYASTNYVAHALISLSLMVIIILLDFLILSDFMLSNVKDELFTTENYYKEKMKQYEDTEKNIELMNIKAHDLKKEVETLRKANENISEEYLKGISDVVSEYEYTYDTGNSVLDVLLTDRMRKCRSEGIELTATLDGASLGFMKKGEVFSLFSNLLDNAIEAVAKLDNPEEKIISLSAVTEKGFVKIIETNYFSGSVDFENNMPVTSKEDKENHGYGTKSIAYVVSQLNGCCRFEADRNIFTISVLIPLPAKE